MKKVIQLVLISFLLIYLPAQAAAREFYVALGDSLAAGQTPYQQIDQGYTDLVAAELARFGNLSMFSKNLAFPGFTTKQVLESIQTDEAKELLKQSTLITISAGANDLLRVVSSDPERGTLSYQQKTADLALNQARISLEQLLEELQTLAPNAKVYVVGYYFAYPHAAEFQKQGTAKELERLNQVLKVTADQYGAVYVSVKERMNTNLTGFIPNPGDVHPTQEGYRQMANSVLYKYNQRLTIEPYEMPVPNPLTFEEIQQMQDEVEETDQASHTSKNAWALASPLPLI